MAKYTEKYELIKKPKALGDNTGHGPGGYVVFRSVTDSACDVFEAPIAEFKYKTHAEMFLEALRQKTREKNKQTGPYYEEVKELK